MVPQRNGYVMPVRRGWRLSTENERTTGYIHESDRDLESTRGSPITHNVGIVHFRDQSKS
jgi:hypothetical protein